MIKEEDGCGEGINHGVVIVGYSDPEPETVECIVSRWFVNCPDGPAPENTSYWKLMNSWGTGWGDQGFLRI